MMVRAGGMDGTCGWGVDRWGGLGSLYGSGVPSVVASVMQGKQEN